MLFLLPLSVFLLLYLLKKRRDDRKSKNFPSALAIIQYLRLIKGENPGEVLASSDDKNKQVICFRLGTINCVVLNSYNAIYEALVQKSESFDARPHSKLITELSSDGYGVVFAGGRRWKTSKRLCHKAIRDVGIGNIEIKIGNEATRLLEELGRSQDRDLQKIISKAVINVISDLVFGRRYEYNDITLINLETLLRRSVKNPRIGKALSFSTFFPCLQYIPWFRRTISQQVNQYKFLREVFTEDLRAREQKRNENQAGDFLDTFLDKKLEQENNPCYSEENLYQCVRDIFDAGVISTPSVLMWIIFALLCFPDYQERIAEEIFEATEKDGRVTTNKKTETPLTRAFISEVMRMKTIGSIAFLHKATVDCTIQGYSIRKNSNVIANLWSIHHDSSLFENPEEFRPERFLDNEGKFVPSKHLVPFSIGMRQCLGHNLAKTLIYLFTASIIQKYRMKSTNPLNFCNGIFKGVTYEPMPFRVTFENRSIEDDASKMFYGGSES